MFLSDADIKQGVKDGRITLKPFNESRLQPASYDILLGNKFVINETSITHFVDPSRKIFAKTREISVKDGGEFILHPGVSVLGVSKEFLGSKNYLIQIGGKSSLARIGLIIHNTAGLINPGHFLYITFELCNLNNIPIILRPGMEIAQLTFSELSSSPYKHYKEVGRFAKNNWYHFTAKKELSSKKNKFTKKVSSRKK